MKKKVETASESHDTLSGFASWRCYYGFLFAFGVNEGMFGVAEGTCSLVDFGGDKLLRACLGREGEEPR